MVQRRQPSTCAPPSREGARGGFRLSDRRNAFVAVSRGSPPGGRTFGRGGARGSSTVTSSERVCRGVASAPAGHWDPSAATRRGPRRRINERDQATSRTELAGGSVPKRTDSNGYGFGTGRNGAGTERFGSQAYGFQRLRIRNGTERSGDGAVRFPSVRIPTAGRTDQQRTDQKN